MQRVTAKSSIMFRFSTLSALIFSIGCAATITQVLCIREFMVAFYGNELVIGVTLALWLAGISTGALIGSIITDKKIWLNRLLYILIITYILLLPVIISIIRSIRTIFDIEAGQYFPVGTTILASLICLIPPGLIIGILFPVMVKVFRNKSEESAITIGKVYLIESLGSLAGGLLFSFVLVRKYNPFSIIGLAATFMLLPLFILAIRETERRKRWVWGIITSALLTIVVHSYLSQIAVRLDSRTYHKRWDSLKLGSELLYNTDSKYQNIAVAASGDQFILYTNCNYFATFPDPYYTSQIVHLIMAFHPKPENVLLVGSILPEFLKEIIVHPVKRLDCVTIDPVLIQTVHKYSKRINNPRIFYHYQEGREFIKNHLVSDSLKYQMVIVNVPEPSTAMLNRYYTIDFYRDVKQILSEDGIIVISAQSASNYFSENIRLYSSVIYSTLKEVFPAVSLVPGEQMILIGAGSDNYLTEDPAVLAERFKQRNIHTKYFTPYSYEALMPADRIRFTLSQIEKNDWAKRNTDLRPIAYYINLILWDSQTKSGFEKILKFLYKNCPIIIFPIGLLFAVTWISIHTKIRQKWSVTNYLYIMFSTGMWSLAQSLALIYLFQNHFGYIYRDIGVLIGLFMFGLSLGSFISNMIVKSKPDISNKKFLLLSEALIGGLIVAQLLLLLVEGYHLKLVYILLITLCGMGTGIQYPIINRILIHQGFPTGKTAGIIDSMDHLGGFLGALLTNIILIPLLGLAQTLLFLLIIKATGYITLLISK